MLAMAISEGDIAHELGVDRSTINRDKKAIKEESQQFIFNLAKGDLSYHYVQKLDSLEQTKREAWSVFNNTTDETLNKDKVKLLALKIIITADEAAIKLLSEGPGIMAVQSLQQQVETINEAGR